MHCGANQGIGVDAEGFPRNQSRLGLFLTEERYDE
jgi:hypothetical protein